MVSYLTRHDVVELLFSMVKVCSQKEVAEELGVSAQYLNDVLLERRKPGKSILVPLGLEQVALYLPEVPQVVYRGMEGKG